MRRRRNDQSCKNMYNLEKREQRHFTGDMEMQLRQDAVLFSMQTDTLISIADDIWQNCEETHANNLNYTVLIM